MPGYAEPKRLLLGLGELYLNDVPVGVLKGSVVFTYTPTYAYQRPGNSMSDVKSERTSEEMTLTASVCDIKLPQLRKAMGINEALVSESSTLRKQEVLKLSATADISLAQTLVGGTLKVWKLDRSTLYVSSTDYSATTTTIARKSGGALTAGQYVIVEYDFADAGASKLKVGGEQTTPNTFELNFVHVDSAGKITEITFYKAVVNTALTLAFNQKQSGDFTVQNFAAKALVDLTKPEGQNLGEIVREDDALITP